MSFSTDTVTTESNDILSVWFKCRSCQFTFLFRTIDEFLDHKKQKHFTEFQNVQCIVFEEREQNESFYNTDEEEEEDVEMKLFDQDDGDGDGDVELCTGNETCEIFSRLIAEPSLVSKRELSLPHMNLSGNASAIRAALELKKKPRQESEFSAYNFNDPCELQASLVLNKSTQTESKTQHDQSHVDVENHSTDILRQNLSPDFSFADADAVADADEEGANVQDPIDPLSEIIFHALNDSTLGISMNPTPKNPCRRPNANQLSLSKLVISSHNKGKINSKTQRKTFNSTLTKTEEDIESYKTKIALSRHRNSHYGTQKEIHSFKCSFPGCKSSFNTKSELKYHTERHANSKPKSILNHFKFPDPGQNPSDPLTLREWLVKQKSLEGSNLSQPETDVNIIRLDPDLTEMNGTEAIRISGETPVKCKLCNKNLESEAEVKVHVTHCWFRNKSRHIYCLPCNKSLSSPVVLRNHNTTIHIERKRKQKPTKILQEYKCHVCSKQFSSISNLNKHVKRHKSGEERERPFVCEICGKAYSMKHELKLHKVTHTDDRPFKCSYPNCIASFQFKNNLQQHTPTHLPKPQNIPRLICCPKEGCSKCFRTKRDLSAHLRTVLHTGVVKPKSWKCTQDSCNQVYVNKSSLDRHMITAHRIGGELPTFECEICKKTFTWKIGKTLHMRWHSEDRPFKCTYDGCEKAYKDKGTLVEHIHGKHTGERPFQCELCGKVYYRKTSLKWHMGVHKKSQNENPV